MRSQQTIQKCVFALMAAALVAVAGCGGGGSSSPASTGGNGGNGGGGAPGSNTVAITVNTGPAAAPPINEAFVDGAFTSVTVCVPNSSNCQTIGGILVDTGSSGLRILSSAVTVPLPQQTASGGAPVVECLPFLSSVTWGPVVTADVTLGGEHAKSLPIQVIGTSQFPDIPIGCTNFGPPQEDLAHLAANGLLGVGSFAQDCGNACTVSGGQNPGLYYACPAAGCAVTEESLAAQVANPVAFFATDNNGVMIELPAVSSPEPSVSGSMTFGIGTQSNNALGSATVYTLDPDTGNITTTFKGVTYGRAFLDTGSNAIYFLDSSVTGIPTCADLPFWYCPSSTLSLSAMNRGTNGASTTVNFSVANADSLTTNPNNAALPNLAGPQPGNFDFGLPFFFGRTVFVSIEGKSAPGGTTPYVAY